MRDRLLTTAFLAALLHGIVILGVTFRSAASGGRAPGLEVLIVGEDVPEAERNEDAVYLAQRTQLGSGTASEARAARSPAALRDVRAQAGDPAGRELQAAARTSDGAAEQLLTSTAPVPEIRYVAAASEPAAEGLPLLLEERRGRQGLGAEDEEVELRGEARDELWITPGTSASVLAPYLELWRRKIERLGTLNFPAAARVARNRRNPVLEVAIASSGALESATVRRSSGSSELDQAALGILRLASPFDPFPRELAAKYRVLRFAYEWQFLGDRVEQGRVMAPADPR